MNRLYLATFVAVIVTTSLGSHLLAIGAMGPAKRGVRARLRSALRGLFVRLKRFVDGRVAAVLAHRERQAAMFVLRHFSDRELKDIGLCRGDLAHLGRASGRERRSAATGNAHASQPAGEALR